MAIGHLLRTRKQSPPPPPGPKMHVGAVAFLICCVRVRARAFAMLSQTDIAGLMAVSQQLYASKDRSACINPGGLAHTTVTSR
eukprot:COSAG03_NODE_2931_length_2348_cov_4.362828_4_plen_83_part_00